GGGGGGVGGAWGGEAGGGRRGPPNGAEVLFGSPGDHQRRPGAPQRLRRAYRLRPVKDRAGRWMRPPVRITRKGLPARSDRGNRWACVLGGRVNPSLRRGRRWRWPPPWVLLSCCRSTGTRRARSPIARGSP